MAMLDKGLVAVVEGSGNTLACYDTSLKSGFCTAGLRCRSE